MPEQVYKNKSEENISKGLDPTGKRQRYWESSDDEIRFINFMTEKQKQEEAEKIRNHPVNQRG